MKLLTVRHGISLSLFMNYIVFCLIIGDTVLKNVVVEAAVKLFRMRNKQSAKSNLINSGLFLESSCRVMAG